MPRFNLSRPKVPNKAIRMALHRCNSCGKATASPIMKCGERHCPLCRKVMARMAFEDLIGQIQRISLLNLSSPVEEKPTTIH